MKTVEEPSLSSQEHPGRFLFEISHEDRGWADPLIAAVFASAIYHARWAEDEATGLPAVKKRRPRAR